MCSGSAALLSILVLAGLHPPMMRYDCPVMSLVLLCLLHELERGPSCRRVFLYVLHICLCFSYQAVLLMLCMLASISCNSAQLGSSMEELAILDNPGLERKGTYVQITHQSLVTQKRTGSSWRLGKSSEGRVFEFDLEHVIRNRTHGCLQTEEQARDEQLRRKLRLSLSYSLKATSPPDLLLPSDYSLFVPLSWQV